MKRINILRYVALSLLGIFIAGSAMGEESKPVQKASGPKQSCWVPSLESGSLLEWQSVEWDYVDGVTRSCLELQTYSVRVRYEGPHEQWFESNPLSIGWSLELSQKQSNPTVTSGTDKCGIVTYAYKANFKRGNSFSGVEFDKYLALLAATSYKNSDRSLPGVQSGQCIEEKISVVYTIPGNNKEFKFEKSPEQLAKLLGLSKL